MKLPVKIVINVSPDGMIESILSPVPVIATVRVRHEALPFAIRKNPEAVGQDHDGKYDVFSVESVNRKG